LTKQDYQRIQSELRFQPALVPTLGILLLDAFLLVCFGRLIRTGGIAGFVVAQFFLAIVFFNSFSILHECGHHSAFRARWMNSLVGHYASTFCFIPFFPWRYIHQKHHTFTGNLEQDPVLKSLRKFRDHGVPGLIRFLWRSWVPANALIQHFVYLLYPLEMRRAGELRGGRLLRCALSIAWMPIGYWLLAWLAPDVVHLRNIVPAIVLFLFAEELVNLPHHFDMPVFDGELPLWEQYRTTRSCYYPRGLSELLVLNFNFHAEHHMFPSLPWYRLRRARALIRPVLGDDYSECIGIGWNIKNRKRDLDAIIDRYRPQTLSTHSP
jgi:fatty acid desaturase